jgi:Astacin (Peptidase family M12A)
MSKFQEKKTVAFHKLADKVNNYATVSSIEILTVIDLNALKGGVQVFNLWPNTIGKGCFKLYTIVHELLHTLGFFHMQV